MAWNEPGNNNGNKDRDNDPWGNDHRGGRDQGPPDLDEVFNKLSQKLGGKFGKKGGKGPSFSGGSAIGIGVLVVVAIAVWFFSGFYTIGEAEKGVVLRLGKYDRIVGPGLNWKPTFIDQVTTVDVRSIRSLRASGIMLTKDENVVSVAMDIQYKVKDYTEADNGPYKYLFRVTNADDSLSQAADSALRAVIGDALMDSILTNGRQMIRETTQETLNDIISKYDMGIEIVDVNFQSARPPEQVKDAFDDAIAAREDEETYIRKAEAYENEIIPKATGRSERVKREALGYSERVINEAYGQVAQFEKLLPEYQAAPKVTRERLYLDAMEQVYSSTSKVLIDSKSSGSLLYLPIDKLLGQADNAPTKRELKSSPLYDQITLDADMKKDTSGTDSQPTRSTTRQGRY